MNLRGSDFRDSCMDWSDILLQHDVLHQRNVGHLYTFWIKWKLEILWQFFILLSEHRLCAFGLRTLTWQDGFIWYLTAWWPISPRWNLSAWILKNMKFGDYMAVFLTFQLSEHRFCTSQHRTPTWMDGFIWWRCFKDLDLRDDWCIPGFTPDGFIWIYLTASSTSYSNEACLME